MWLYYIPMFHCVCTLAYSDTLRQVNMLGIQQQYKLGQYMRRRYHGFISDSYIWEEMQIRSSDIDRTLRSAQAHLAGLYPPTAEDKFNSSLPWRPAAIHTIPYSQEDLGIQQQYKLGQYMRRRYHGFISDSYIWEEMQIRSSDIDRTLRSAQAHLAGLYPPTAEDKFNSSLPWRPAAIHTIPYSQEDLLFTLPPCPRAAMLLEEGFKSKRGQDYIKRTQTLFDFLSKKTGMKVSAKNHLLYDTLIVQREHGFKSPAWFNESVERQLKSAAKFCWSLMYRTDECKRIYGGNMLKAIISNIERKMESDTIGDSRHKTPKVYMYSAHDTTIILLLATLGISVEEFPPPASVMLVELHRRNETSEYFLRIFYQDPSSELRLLRVRGCDPDCPVNKFISLTQPYIPHDWKRECEVTQGLGTVGVVLISLFVGGCFALIIIVTVTHTLLVGGKCRS